MLILSYQILLYSGEKCHNLKILKVAFEDQPVERQQAVEWFSQFKNDVTSVKDAKPEGQETVAFHNHARPYHPPPPPKKKVTIHEVANMLGISSGSIQCITKDNLNMHQIATEFLPCLPSEEEDYMLAYMLGPPKG